MGYLNVGCVYNVEALASKARNQTMEQKRTRKDILMGSKYNAFDAVLYDRKRLESPA